MFLAVMFNVFGCFFLSKGRGRGECQGIFPIYSAKKYCSSSKGEMIQVAVITFCRPKWVFSEWMRWLKPSWVIPFNPCSAELSSKMAFNVGKRITPIWLFLNNGAKSRKNVRFSESLELVVYDSHMEMGWKFRTAWKPTLNLFYLNFPPNNAICKPKTI